MFSPLLTSGSPRASWREAIRRALGLAVAFATLESYELPGNGPHGSVEPPLRASRSADLARSDHPHRAPLRAPRRARRPGRVLARAQPCVAHDPTRAPRRRRAPQRAH